MYRYVLFDLDGTLTDPKEGICKCVQYALHEMGIEEPDLDRLECFIGPPLLASFRDFYRMDDAQCELAVKKYRERYATIGIFENELYPGMEELLKRLSEKGIRLAIASSKPQLFVERILKHFKIESYFEVVAGSDMNGKKVEKTDVMRDAIAGLFHTPEDCVMEQLQKKDGKHLPTDQILMVGDRKFDVEGAQSFGIESVGVGYGYAEEGELKEAGATYITDDLSELYRIITGERMPQPTDKKNAFQKSIYVLMPLVYNFVLTGGILLIIQVILDTLLKGSLSGYSAYFTEHSSQYAVFFDAFATLICGIVFARMYQKEKKKPISGVVKRRNQMRLKKDGLLIVLAGMALALFLNIVFSHLHILTSSETYKQVAGVQYSVSIVRGLIIYGLIKPVEEELVFRGLIYGRMRLYFPKVFCIPISALIFGCYHGNLVQAVYGFLMGCVMAWLYENYRGLTASVLFHSAANVIVFLFSMVPVLGKMASGVVAALVSGLAAVIIIGILWQKNKNMR